MAVYLGTERVKINLSGTQCHLNLLPSIFIGDKIIPISSDSYILRDNQGTYLIASEEE